LICGGGSGHEPAHAGFVAEGCLSASVCGGVFASPSTKSIIEAIEYLKNPKGILLIIKNYTGDIMNFESAALRCSKQGINIKTLVVNDDIAFMEKDPERKEARGLCGTVLVYKMLGAACQSGVDLDKVH
jgi:dihydroxyacetone kinase